MNKAKVDGTRTEFPETLKSIRDGELAYECGQAMEELVLAVRETGKGGELTVKVAVKPAAAGDGAKVLVVAPRPKVKLPEPETLPSMFYTTEHGTLCRDNPDQLAFGFSEPGKNAGTR